MALAGSATSSRVRATPSATADKSVQALAVSRSWSSMVMVWSVTFCFSGMVVRYLSCRQLRNFAPKSNFARRSSSRPDGSMTACLAPDARILAIAEPPADSALFGFPVPNPVKTTRKTLSASVTKVSKTSPSFPANRAAFAPALTIFACSSLRSKSSSPFSAIAKIIASASAGRSLAKLKFIGKLSLFLCSEE